MKNRRWKYLCFICNYGYTMNRILPHSKRDERLYFIKSEIDKWVVKHRLRTIEKLEDEAIGFLINKSNVYL